VDTELVVSTWAYWQPIVISLGIIIAALIVGAIVFQVVFLILKTIALRSESEYFMPIVTHWRRPLRAIFLLALVNFVLPLLNLSEGWVDVLRHLLVLGLIAAVGWLAIMSIDVVRDIIVARYDIDKKDNLVARRIQTQIRILARIASAAIYIITIASALMTFPKVQQLGVSILASAGIAGVVIGFAAQKSLGNLLAGIQIAFTQPIRIDDVVIIEGEYGVIEEITLTYVVVRIWDLRRLIIPINYFIENTFQNWTRVSADLLGTVYLYVDYEVSVQAVREELRKILESTEYWDGKVQGLLVTDNTEESVQIRALMSAPDAPTAWNLRCHVREKLIEFLQKEYPSSLPRTRIELKGSDDAPLQKSA
jgi:small-conductance mechanosensitive channel